MAKPRRFLFTRVMYRVLIGEVHTAFMSSVDMKRLFTSAWPFVRGVETVWRSLEVNRQTYHTVIVDFVPNPHYKTKKTGHTR